MVWREEEEEEWWVCSWSLSSPSSRASGPPLWPSLKGNKQTKKQKKVTGRGGMKVSQTSVLVEVGQKEIQSYP